MIYRKTTDRHKVTFKCPFCNRVIIENPDSVKYHEERRCKIK